MSIHDYAEDDYINDHFNKRYEDDYDDGSDDIEHLIDDYREHKRIEDLEGFDSEEQRDEWYNG